MPHLSVNASFGCQVFEALLLSKSVVKAHSHSLIHESLPAGMSVLASHDGSDAGLPVVPDRGVSHVRAEEDDRLMEHLGSDARHQDRVHAAQLHVNLQTQVGQGLWGRLVNILSLQKNWNKY